MSCDEEAFTAPLPAVAHCPLVRALQVVPVGSQAGQIMDCHGHVVILSNRRVHFEVA